MLEVDMRPAVPRVGLRAVEFTFQPATSRSLCICLQPFVPYALTRLRVFAVLLYECSIFIYIFTGYLFLYLYHLRLGYRIKKKSSVSLLLVPSMCGSFLLCAALF